MVIVDSVYTVRDSATKRMLGERFTVYAAKLSVLDRDQPDRVFDARPLVIYADGEPVASKGAEIPALRIRYGLASVEGDKVGLNVAEAEFVVIEAIMFPGINILWSGCVLLALGTGLAVWRRLRERGRRDDGPRGGTAPPLLER